MAGQVLGRSVKDAYMQTIKCRHFHLSPLAAESNASKLGSTSSSGPTAVSQVASILSVEEAGKILNLQIPGSTLEQAKEVPSSIKQSIHRNSKDISDQMQGRTTGADPFISSQSSSGHMSALKKNPGSIPNGFRLCRDPKDPLVGRHATHVGFHRRWPLFMSIHDRESIKRSFLVFHASYGRG